VANDSFDWTEWSDWKEAIDLFGQSIREGVSYNAYGNKKLFTAVALTDLFPLTPQQAMGIDGASTAATGAQRFAFRGRILGNNSPHSFLPDPCDPGDFADASIADKINWAVIQMHTLFLSTHLDTSLNITRGDVVHVELQEGGIYKYNLKYGKIVGVAAHENPRRNRGRCSSLISLFGPIQRGGVNITPPGATGPQLVPQGRSPPALTRNTTVQDMYGNAIGDYTTFSANTNSADGAAKPHFDQFLADVIADTSLAGITPTITSAGRSVKHQYKLMLELTTAVGAPCYSNHNVGFALDIKFVGGGAPTFGGVTDTAYMRWVQQNIEPHATNNNIVYYDTGRTTAVDNVHFTVVGGGQAATAIKRKCIDYYYNQAWPADPSVSFPGLAALGTPGTLHSSARAKEYAKKWPANFVEDPSMIEP
jgi:hypothetical protein